MLLLHLLAHPLTVEFVLGALGRASTPLASSSTSSISATEECCSVILLHGALIAMLGLANGRLAYHDYTFSRPTAHLCRCNTATNRAETAILVLPRHHYIDMWSWIIILQLLGLLRLLLLL